MPLTIAQIMKRTKPLTVTFEVDGHSEEIHLVYRPAYYTAERERAWKAAKDEAGRAEQLVSQLVDLLESWDVLDGKKPYPITKESLAVLDTDGFLTTIYTAILTDLYPNLTPAAISGAGSSKADE